MTTHALPPRSWGAMLFAAAPVVFALLLLVGGGTVVLLGTLGGEARGERLEVRFGVPCASGSGEPVRAAAELLAARAESIGLGEPIWSVSGDEITLVATMPGLPDDATAMPTLLARQGALAILRGDEVLAGRGDLEQVALRLDDAGLPVADLLLSSGAADRLREAIAADPDGELAVTVDGQAPTRRPNSLPLKGNHLLLPGEGATAARMRAATDHAIVLGQGPLPCALDVRTTRLAPGS